MILGGVIVSVNTSYKAEHQNIHKKQDWSLHFQLGLLTHLELFHEKSKPIKLTKCINVLRLTGRTFKNTFKILCNQKIGK